MKPFQHLATATAPDGSELKLYRHDADYVIRLDGVELMSTRRRHSEERLAHVACAPLQSTSGPTALIGGLGFGFTLAAALRLLPADAHVVVAEILREVIDWNRDPRYSLAGVAMADPRVELRHDDVANVLRANPAAFDAIMLDVDNGADSLVTKGNARLYGDAGIRTAAAALRPGGRLVYWSADDDRRFVKALRRGGLTVEAERVRAHATSGGFHFLFIARRAAG